MSSVNVTAGAVELITVELLDRTDICAFDHAGVSSNLSACRHKACGALTPRHQWFTGSEYCWPISIPNIQLDAHARCAVANVGISCHTLLSMASLKYSAVAIHLLRGTCQALQQTPEHQHQIIRPIKSNYC